MLGDFGKCITWWYTLVRTWLHDSWTGLAIPFEGRVRVQSSTYIPAHRSLLPWIRLFPLSCPFTRKWLNFLSGKITQKNKSHKDNTYTYIYPLPLPSMCSIEIHPWEKKWLPFFFTLVCTVPHFFPAMPVGWIPWYWNTLKPWSWQHGSFFPAFGFDFLLVWPTRALPFPQCESQREERVIIDPVLAKNPNQAWSKVSRKKQISTKIAN